MFFIACLFSRCIKCNMYLVVSQCSIASLVFQHSNAVVVEASNTMQYYRSNICNIQSDIQPVVLHQLHAIYHMYSRNIFYIHIYYIQMFFPSLWTTWSFVCGDRLLPSAASPHAELVVFSSTCHKLFGRIRWRPHTGPSKNAHPSFGSWGSIPENLWEISVGESGSICPGSWGNSCCFFFWTGTGT